jgi:hypothetical protein
MGIRIKLGKEANLRRRRDRERLGMYGERGKISGDWEKIR